MSDLFYKKWRKRLVKKMEKTPTEHGSHINELLRACRAVLWVRPVGVLEFNGFVGSALVVLLHQPIIDHT